MIIHEFIHSDANDLYSIWTNDDLSYGPHFHNAIEFCYTIYGEINYIIDGKLYSIKKGEAVVCMPNQIHSLSTPERSRIQFIRIRPDVIGMFYVNYNSKLPKNSKFIVTHPELIGKGLWQPEHIYQVLSLVYSLINDLCLQCGGWTDRENESFVINDLLTIAENNFSSDISLRSISERLHYSYTYLSTKFSKIIGVSFNEYINNCRINHACWLLKNTDLSATKIAHECGYNSIRSFNRNFSKLTGMTPTDFKKKCQI